MSNINIKAILKIVSVILIIEAAFFILCIPVALIYSEPVAPFLLSALLSFLPGIVIFLIIRRSIYDVVSSREGYISVTLSWIVLTVAGTLPFLISNTIPDFVNALFESVSGFTTTGASILSDVESLPRSILFWRSLTHWIGGVGIILLVIIVLPTLKVGGYNLFSLESSLKEKILPKTKSVSYTILSIYLGMSITEVIFLLAGKMSLFDSLCFTFGTVATGGFSIRNSGLAEYSPYIQYVVAIFMFLSATSYLIFYYLIKRQYKKIKENDELWFFIYFTLAAVAFVTLILFFKTQRDFSTSFRDSFFQVISQISCTGFATTDYMAWPYVGWFFMFILMFAGGCMGSTAGGIKMARHLIAFKNVKSLFLKIRHPNAVHPIRFNGKLIPENINNTMILFILVYLVIFLAGMMVMQLSGISITESAGASATSMAGIGPGLGASGNMGNFSAFNGTAKLTMVFLMLTGRLELFTILALFTKSFWRN